MSIRRIIATVFAGAAIAGLQTGCGDPNSPARTAGPGYNPAKSDDYYHKHGLKTIDCPALDGQGNRTGTYKTVVASCPR